MGSPTLFICAGNFGERMEGRRLRDSKMVTEVLRIFIMVVEGVEMFSKGRG